MKRLVSIIVIAAMAAAMFISCEKDTVKGTGTNDDPQEGNYGGDDNGGGNNGGGQQGNEDSPLPGPKAVWKVSCEGLQEDEYGLYFDANVSGYGTTNVYCFYAAKEWLETIKTEKEFIDAVQGFYEDEVEYVATLDEEDKWEVITTEDPAVVTFEWEDYAGEYYIFIAGFVNGKITSEYAYCSLTVTEEEVYGFTMTGPLTFKSGWTAKYEGRYVDEYYEESMDRISASGVTDNYFCMDLYDAIPEDPDEIRSALFYSAYQAVHYEAMWGFYDDPITEYMLDAEYNYADFYTLDEYGTYQLTGQTLKVLIIGMDAEGNITGNYGVSEVTIDGHELQEAQPERKALRARRPVATRKVHVKKVKK